MKSILKKTWSTFENCKFLNFLTKNPFSHQKPLKIPIFLSKNPIFFIKNPSKTPFFTPKTPFFTPKPPFSYQNPHFPHQNPHFLYQKPLKNPHFPLKNPIFPLKNPFFPIKNPSKTPIFPSKTHKKTAPTRDFSRARPDFSPKIPAAGSGVSYTEVGEFRAFLGGFCGKKRVFQAFLHIKRGVLRGFGGTLHFFSRISQKQRKKKKVQKRVF
jgi:hypothetical protein